MGPSLGAVVRYLLIERYKPGCEAAVYERLADKGRRMPAGTEYVASWVTADIRVCYQVVRCENRAQLDAFIACWQDLVDFEVIEVLTSEQAAEAVAKL